MPGTTDGACFIVGIGSGSNYGAISNTAVFFIGHSSRAGGCSNIACLIAGYSAYRTKLAVAHEFFQLLMGMIQRIIITIADLFQLIVPELGKEIFVGFK